MLGLASLSNLMDMLAYSTYYHNLGSNPPLIDRRFIDNIGHVSLIDSDPILEDSPDNPDEIDGLDYTVHTPEVGQNVTVSESGSEIEFDTPQKNKRALCFFSSQNSLDCVDSDEYPFDAITYGEGVGCLGLPYNDHNYAASELPYQSTHSDDNRLSLLAKLALAKDDKSTDRLSFRKPVSQSGMGVILPDDDPSSMGFQLSSTIALLSPKSSTVNHLDVESHSLKSSQSFTTNSRISSVGSRAVLLPTTQNSASNPPLQVHRVSSSLTPHIVLRTGAPALQISTTALRSGIPPAEFSGTVRCRCGSSHNDVPVIQCDVCRSWQHLDCVSSNGDSRLAAPFVCDRCQPRHLQGVQNIIPQRTKLPNMSGSNHTGIRISRPTPLVTGGHSGHIILAAPVHNAASRQLQFCFPTPNALSIASGNHTELALLSTASGNGLGNGQYFNLVTRSATMVAHQSLRSSKRKQDLLTLAGASPNSGIECLPASVDPSDGLGALGTTSVQNSLVVDSTVSSTAPSILHDTPSLSDQPIHKVSGGSLHRLLVYDKNHPYGNCHPVESNEESRHASPLFCTVSSDTSLTPLDAYEEVPDLRLSERFCQKLDCLYPSSGSPSALCDLPGYYKEDALPKMPSRRCQVVSFDFNRKGLVAVDDLSPQDHVIEYRGMCMLLSEYNEMYDYRKHYNPFVLFYKSWSKVTFCVDARKFGNEARFVRRSCTPNCEVRHFLSVSHDPVTGPAVRIRLVIVATRPVARSNELTLPFDFDYTTCRYLVKCACARKACPVARWFRQTSLFDSADVRNASVSLISSHKSPFHFRGSGPGSRPRGFVTNNQDNYSDILADDCDQADRDEISNWAGEYSSTDSLETLGRIRPHRTFRSGSFKNVSKSVEFIRPDRSRGRRRGRRGRDSLESASKSHGFFVRKIKRIGRGCPPGIIGQHTRRTNGCRKFHRKNYDVNLKRRRSDENSSVCHLDHSRLSRLHERRLSSGCFEDGLDNSVSFPSTGRSSLKRLTVAIDCDDLDAETEPECNDSLDETDAVVLHLSDSGLSSPCHKVDRSSFTSNPRALKSSTQPRMGSSSTNDVTENPRVRVVDEQTRIAKTKRNLPHLNGERRRRHRSNSRITTSPTDTKPIQESKKQSREEMWMEEVLRRIQRMEKKHQHKLRCDSSDQLGVPLDVSINVKDSPSTCNLGRQNDSYDVTCDDGSYKTENGVLSSTCLPDTIVDDFKCSGSNKTSPRSPVSPIKAETVAVSSSVDFCSPKSDIASPVIGNFQPPSQRKGSKSSTRRRRSESVLLSDVLSNGLLPDQHDSREDRWLKSQLRRIAELELGSSTSLPSADELQKSLTVCELDSSIPDVGTLDGLCDNDCSSAVDYQNGVTSDCDNGHLLTDTPQSDSFLFVETSSERRRESPSTAAFLDDIITDRDVSTKNKAAAVSHSVDLNDSSVSPKCSKRILEANADCELIVYRTQEKDPLAKFSRSRLIESPTFAVSLHESVSLPLESVDATKLSNTSQIPSTHPTPRPTKKRWLCQALMEEDLSGSSSLVQSTVDPSATLSTDEPSQSHTVFPSNVTNTPVNPKKRIISQFSGISEDTRGSKMSDPPSGNACSETCSTTTCMSTIGRPLVNGGSVDLANPQSAPLPPKKATVEEMRKVRVSLSEYRRRRGLSSNATQATSTKFFPGSEFQGYVVDPLPKILSPNKLLDEIPKLYNQLRIPGKQEFSLNEYIHSSLPSLPLSKDESAVMCRGQGTTESMFDELVDRSAGFSDYRIDERGPRTPSEPIDEEDGDSNNTVYVRCSGKSNLDAIAEESCDSVAPLQVPANHQSPVCPSTNCVNDHPSSSPSNNTSNMPLSESSFVHNATESSTRATNVSVESRGVRELHSATGPLVDSPTNSFLSNPSTPPPPPPDLPANSLLDLRTIRPGCNADQGRRHSGSDVPRIGFETKPNSLDYFIKRDQEIRQWQETRSFEWERKRSVPRHRSVSQTPNVDRRVRSSSRQFHLSKHPADMSDSHTPNVPRITDRLLDVHETLHRLHDCLRSQLDKSKHSRSPGADTIYITNHIKNSSVSDFSVYSTRNNFVPRIDDKLFGSSS